MWAAGVGRGVTEKCVRGKTLTSQAGPAGVPRNAPRLLLCVSPQDEGGESRPNRSQLGAFTLGAALTIHLFIQF